MPQPNIIIVMTDQQQARCCRREGFALDTTPFLDGWARCGTWFNRAYTPMPICAPARVSMLTGRYPGSTGVRMNHQVNEAEYQADLLDVLKGQGYVCAMMGKNHSHWKKDNLDYWYELGHGGVIEEDTPATNDEKEFDSWLCGLRHGVSDKPTPFPLELQLPYRLASRAGNWIRGNRSNQPFFMWLSFAEPHNPYQVPEPYFSMFPRDSMPPLLADESVIPERGFKWQFLSQLQRRSLDRFDELLPFYRSNYYGMLRLIDDQMARFHNVLEQEGILNNTIVFFVADHGDFVGDFGLMRKGVGMPEDLMRIPFFVAGPGVLANRDSHPAFVSLVDVMPTICEALGVSIAPGVQGRSLWPLLTGRDYPAEQFESIYAEEGFGGLDYNWEDNPDFDKFGRKGAREISFNELNQYTLCGIRRMLRRGPWKLIYDMNGKGQLYNLDSDPAESANLFDEPDYAEIRGQLLEELLKKCLQAQDPLPLPGGLDERKNHPENYWL